MKNTIKNTISSAVIILALLVTGTKVQAKDPVKDPVELTVLGKIENRPVLKLAMDLQGNKDVYELNITDEHGFSLHRETIKGDIFEKKYMLGENEEYGDFVFELTNLRTKKTTSYKISQKAETTRNVVVEKI